MGNSSTTATIVEPFDPLRMVSTSKTTGWVTLRYAPREPRYDRDMPTTGEELEVKLDG